MNSDRSEMVMEIRFWGVRGSIASPLTNQALEQKIQEALRISLLEKLDKASDIPVFVENLPWPVRCTAGGNTSCVHVETEKEDIILDAGTGLRLLGLDLMQKYSGKPRPVHILISHTHWDHISGIPFFAPAYIPGASVTFITPIKDAEQRIRKQQSFDFFPVSLDAFGADIQFEIIEPETPYQLGDCEIVAKELNHPGSCYGFRIQNNKKTIVYATDSEYKNLTADAIKPFSDFFYKADLLIYDAQYTMVENIEKEDWGHSNVFIGIDLALEAQVKNIVFTHHDPTSSDAKLWEILKKSKEYLEIYGTRKSLGLYLAYEGLSISL